MVVLYVTAGQIDRQRILDCFDLNEVEFINNSHPEDEYKLKYYAFDGDIFNLSASARKLNKLTEEGLYWALMAGGARPTLVKANGTVTSRDLENS